MSISKTKTKVHTDFDSAAIEQKARDSLNNVLENFGRRAVELIREELASGSHSGRVYTIHGSPHQASAPDEVPAEYSGQLSESLSYEVSAETSELRIFSNTPYGAYLEYGTMTMAPRPFMAPAMERLEPELQLALQRALGGTTNTDQKDESA